MFQVEGIHAFGTEVHLAAGQTVSNITVLADFSIPEAAVLTFIACCSRLAGNAVISTGRAGSLIGKVSVLASITDFAILRACQTIGVGVLAKYASQSAQVVAVEAGALPIHWC